MNMLLGQLALDAALLAAVAAIVAAIVYLPARQEKLLRLARLGLIATAGFFTVGLWALVSALLDNDVRLDYVVTHSESVLPTFYKVAALWAGQEGSLLLWGWMIAVMAALLAFLQRNDDSNESALSTVAVGLILAFFAGVLLFVDVANPFRPVAEAVTDGHGLNPMLQNLAMVAHPPALFLGYAGFTIPFALMIGALAAGAKTSAWTAAARPWILFSWITLSVGILLGAQWAYVDLAWGGYWAWDPVENASLLPWLTGTALIHSLITQQKRGQLKVWTAALTALTFFLCFFGTWITRSGAITSMHAFEESPIGKVLMTFLITIALASAILIFLNRRRLKPDHPFEALVSREGLVLAGNVLLTAMVAITVVGTTFALLSSFARNLGLASLFHGTRIEAMLRPPTAGESANLDKPFYNMTVLPMALVLGAMMALGPVLTYGKDALTRSRRALLPATFAGLLAFIAGLAYAIVAYRGKPAPEFGEEPTAFATVVWILWTPCVAAIATATIVGILTDFISVVRTWAANHTQNVFLSAIAVIDADHRRWGGYLVHLGMAALIVGVAGSSLYGSSREVTLKKGDSTTVAGYTVTFLDARTQRHPTYSSLVTTLQVTSASGRKTILEPERRTYFQGRNPQNGYAGVDIDFGLRHDLYAVLAGANDPNAPTLAGFQIMINPLINFIWLGGIVMTLGGIFCMLPRFALRPAPIPVPAPPAKKPHARVAVAAS